MNLDVADENLLNSWFRVMRFKAQLRDILDRLRKQSTVKALTGGKQLQDDGEWIGIKGTHDFWAGFGFSQTARGPECYLWVEGTIPGDRRSWINGLEPAGVAAFEKAKEYLQFHRDSDALNFGNLVQGNSRFVFVERLVGSLNADPEAVFAWLQERAMELIKLLDRVQADEVPKERPISDAGLPGETAVI